MVVQLVPYEPSLQDEWDDFVARSKNGTFMLSRPYVEYHADRFVDASLMARGGGGELLAVMPACLTSVDGEQALVSHAGLTYGGWITGRSTTVAVVLEVFDALDDLCRQREVQRVVYKAVPRVYHQVPADEDEYALFLRDATKVRHDVSSVIPLQSRPPLASGRRDGVRRARRAGLRVGESDRIDDFHDLLARVLAEHHAARPTHTPAELHLLQSRFPEQVRLFVAEDEGDVVAGALVFDCGRAVHTQYLASGARGRATGALDLVVVHLLDDVFSDRDHLSFGISTEQGGRVLNRGLIAQKEMFGARATTCATWSWRP